MSKRYFVMAGAVVVVLGALFSPILYWQLFLTKKLPSMDATFFSLQNLAAEQNQELTFVGSNRLSDFDRLVRLMDEGHRLNAQLKDAGITDEAMPPSVKNVAFSYFQSFDEKQEKIERFKSSLAIVRNSLHYLPISRNELTIAIEKRIPQEEKREELIKSVNQIYSKTEDYLLDPDSGRQTRLYMKLDELKDLLDSDYSALNTMVNNFFSHTRVLIKNKPIKEELFKSLMDNTLQKSLGSLRAVYKQYANTVESHKRKTFWYYLFSYIAFVIAFTLWLSFRGQTHTNSNRADSKKLNAFKQQNEQLKSKVLDQADFSENSSHIDTMAATLAHEVNTPLGYVSSNLEVLSLTLKQVNDILEDIDPEADGESSHYFHLLKDLKSSSAMTDIPNVLEDMQKGLLQIQNVVDDIKSFTKKDKEKLAAFELNDCVSSVLRMTESGLANHISVRKKLDASGVPMFGAASEINQIIMNLVVNAGHAIEASKKEKGIIEITTKMQGNHSVFIIKDNGSGMDDDTKSKIYEPFFTTKEPGKGTGLGMSVVYNNICRHHGDIKVISELGKGTAIRVSFPVGETG